MIEYIKREDVARMLETAQIISDGEYYGYCTEDINLNRIPAADVVEVRYAHWEFPVSTDPEDNLDPRMKCSECGEVDTPLARWNYCPNCGAKIDKEAD